MTFAMAFAGGMRAGGLLAVCSLLPCAAAWSPGVTRSPWARSRTRLPTCNALSAADEERLLLTEPALNAFIVAEVKSFLEESMEEMAKGERVGWKMSQMEKLATGLIDGEGRPTEDFKNATSVSDEEAVKVLCATASSAFKEGFNTPGLLSQLGSAISFFRNFFRSAHIIAPLERVGLSDYAVAHHSARARVPLPPRRSPLPARTPRALWRGRSLRHVPPPHLPGHIHQDPAAERQR